ncbi:MAG: hypothetical protein SOH99_02555 [Acidipropionibacterium acidipropionici]|uniref:hypothetical protein n=1 Tax=Acidipropionibacterium acidipropionici TaxID=1748 RepID=UPI002F35CF0D
MRPFPLVAHLPAGRMTWSAAEGDARNAALVDEISGWPDEPGFGVDDVLEALDAGRRER